MKQNPEYKMSNCEYNIHIFMRYGHFQFSHQDYRKNRSICLGLPD